jgi:hypothetical protein
MSLNLVVRFETKLSLQVVVGRSVVVAGLEVGILSVV